MKQSELTIETCTILKELIAALRNDDAGFKATILNAPHTHRKHVWITFADT